MTKKIILMILIGISTLTYSKGETLSDVTCGVESRSLSDITSVVEFGIKQRDIFIIKNRNNIEELTAKFKQFGVNKIEIVSNDTIFKNHF